MTSTYFVLYELIFVFLDIFSSIDFNATKMIAKLIANITPCNRLNGTTIVSIYLLVPNILLISKCANFAYKGIDLSIATNFQIGGKIYDSMYSSFMHAGSNIGSNWHKDILNAWTPENKNTNVPIMDGAQNSNSQSSRFLINASFFNIRNISLGYTFPKEWMKAISASSARIYVSADNVALFSKRKGMDPRQYAYGYSAANYSAIRTLSFGINLNF